MDSVFERLTEKLTAAGVPFAVTRHAPVFTSEEAAAVRGASLASGAKALVVKAGERFVLLVVPADRKLDSKKARTALGVKATPLRQPRGSRTAYGLATGLDPAVRQPVRPADLRRATRRG